MGKNRVPYRHKSPMGQAQVQTEVLAAIIIIIAVGCVLFGIIH